MKRVLPFLALGLLGFHLDAQDVRQQSSILSWPAYSDQQRWDRAAYHAVTFSIGAISFAKASGKTAADAGRHFGDTFAAGWGAANTGVPVRVARGMLFNMAAFPGTEGALVSADDTSATIRYRRNHYTSILRDTGAVYGVTQADYDQFFEQVVARIAAHLGLRSRYEVNGGWATLTFNGRARNAISAFPRSASFRQTLTAEQAGVASLAGSFVLEFSPQGAFELRTSAGDRKVWGRYGVMLDQLTVDQEDGPWACRNYGPGVYRFTPQANGDIVFGRLDDACEGRARFFARRWLR